MARGPHRYAGNSLSDEEVPPLPPPLPIMQEYKR